MSDYDLQKAAHAARSLAESMGATEVIKAFVKRTAPVGGAPLEAEPVRPYVHLSPRYEWPDGGNHPAPDEDDAPWDSPSNDCELPPESRLATGGATSEHHICDDERSFLTDDLLPDGALVPYRPDRLVLHGTLHECICHGDHGPAEVECEFHGVLNCPHNEPLHYHGDGCPACDMGEDGDGSLESAARQDLRVLASAIAESDTAHLIQCGSPPQAARILALLRRRGLDRGEVIDDGASTMVHAAGSAREVVAAFNGAASAARGEVATTTVRQQEESRVALAKEVAKATGAADAWARAAIDKLERDARYAARQENAAQEAAGAFNAEHAVGVRVQHGATERRTLSEAIARPAGAKVQLSDYPPLVLLSCIEVLGPPVMCGICGTDAHWEHDHVTNCDCGTNACSSCVVCVDGESFCVGCKGDAVEAAQQRELEAGSPTTEQLLDCPRNANVLFPVEGES